MFKMFIFSNSYAAHNMINSISYLLNIKVNEIFVLGENHRNDDFNEAVVKVTVNESIEFCVESSDLIVMLLDENVPQKSIEYVKNRAKQSGKTILELRNPWIKTNPTIDKEIYDKMRNTPSVLILSVGNGSQDIYTELAINEMFYNNKVNISQEFSSSTIDLLKQLDYHNLLNSHLHNQLLDDTLNGTLFVATVCISGFDIIQIRSCCSNIINKLCPDVLIIQASLLFDVEKITQIVEYSTSLQTDMVIRSNFILHNNSMVYYANTSSTQELLAGKKSTTSIILKTILAKTAFPEGCKVWP